MHKPLNASLFSVIDLKASHWFEPSQAHFLSAIRTENIRMALARSRETVLMRETLKRMQEFEFAPAAKPDDQ